jgi:tRNA modification GTPase
MSSSTPNDQTVAACLTPPTAGGIAVIQVIGVAAPATVNPVLSAKHPIDVAKMSANELRLGHIVDRGEVLDDVVVAARRLTGGDLVVDLSIHGGTRVVERVLLALAAAGATIVEADALARRSQSAKNLLEQERLELLARAKTRAVASCLARAPASLAAEATRIDRLITEGRIEGALRDLKELCDRFTLSRYLLDGIRVVLTGAPNSGKSTLANALAGAEHSIVSPTAGTTRDWVELPAAFDGLPITLIDTAGIAHTPDVIEQESIRRAQEQLATADIVLHIVDRSTPLRPDLREPSRHRPPRELLVWNKCDLPPDAGYETHKEESGVWVSGRTGEGLADLRRCVLALAGMTGWSNCAVRPFTPRQYQAFQAALSALDAGQTNGLSVHNLLTTAPQPMNSTGKPR